MKRHVESNNIKFSQRRLLISGLKGKEILLSTALIKWYLKHGLRITKIHQVIEFFGGTPFKNFVQEITEKRKEGSRNPDKAVLAQTYKLIGNSSYGSMLMDQMKFEKTSLVQGEQTARGKINSPRFKQLDMLGEELYEMSESPSKIRLKIPIYIGYQILQLAKLRMLEFAYDFLSKYIERPLYQFLYCDTDSLYLSLARESLEECVIESKREEFISLSNSFCSEERSPNAFLSRTCCSAHNFEDDREPGLLKVEFNKGDFFLGLCSKTYVCRDCDSAIKLSCKGVNKQHFIANNNVIDVFKNTLSDRQSREGSNGGIRQYRSQMFSYVQRKDAFTYLYVKRLVDESGVYTSPLNLTLNPCPCELYPIQSTKEMCVEFECPFKYGNRRFKSIMQAICYFMVLNDSKNESRREALLRKILLSTTSKIKEIFKKFECTEKWNAIKYWQMKDILVNRTEQLPIVQRCLLDTQERELVYADNWDREWCAGEEWKVIRWLSEKSIPGKNYIGMIYMEIRKSLVNK